MSDNGPHFNRWCVIDTVPIAGKDGLSNHIYCSFADEDQARMAAREMNRLVRDDPTGKRGRNRTEVKVIHYSYPNKSEA